MIRDNDEKDKDDDDGTCVREVWLERLVATPAPEGWAEHMTPTTTSRRHAHFTVTQEKKNMNSTSF